MSATATFPIAPGRFRRYLLIATVISAVAGFAFIEPGFAAEVSSGNDNISLTLSGQINRGLLYADDGAETALLNVDNDNSSTRVRFVGVGPQINEVFSNFDGLSRDDRIRYDTPTFSGFSLAASYADSRKSDVALRFAGDVGAGIKLAGAVAYAINGNVDSQVNGSISVLHDSGFNVTGAAGVQDLQVGATNPSRDPFFWYAKLGYIWSGGIGDAAFAVDYAWAEEVEDTLAATGDEFTSYGIFVMQNVDKIATELYLGARNHELDRASQNFDDIFAVLGGARVKF